MPGDENSEEDGSCEALVCGCGCGGRRDALGQRCGDPEDVDARRGGGGGEEDERALRKTTVRRCLAR